MLFVLLINIDYVSNGVFSRESSILFGARTAVSSMFRFESLQAQASLAESSRKLDLLRLSLELRRQELPPDSGTAAQLKRELASVQSASPVPVTYTSLQPFRGPLEGRATVPASVSRCAAVTGQLEVREIFIGFSACLWSIDV